MYQTLYDYWRMLATATKRWMSSDPWRESAVIAHYAVFSMPGLLIIIIWTAGAVFGQDMIEGRLAGQLEQYLGEDRVETIKNIISNARLSPDASWIKSLGLVSLLIGATTLFHQLKKSLNLIWGIEAKPKSNLLKILIDRATSLGVVLSIALLLLISLSLSAVVTFASSLLESSLGSQWLLFVPLMKMIFSICLTTVLFCVLYKTLPDAKIGWKSVWLGAFVGALLFTAGEALLSSLFKFVEPASTFGAAGAFIMIMLWINYTSLVLFFGATLAQVYAQEKGHTMQPANNARWLDEGDSRAENIKTENSSGAMSRVVARLKSLMGNR